MKVVFLEHTCAKNGKPVMEGFKKYLVSMGTDVISTKKNDFIDCDLVVMWSMSTLNPIRKKLWDTYRSKNINFLILEVGALKRNEYWRVGINGINRSASFFNQNSPSDRWDGLNIKMEPWRKDGKSIIICAQSKFDLCWDEKITMEQWTLDVIQQIRAETNRHIIVRQHPRAPLKMGNIPYDNIDVIDPSHIQNTYDDFDMVDAMQNAWAIVNHNSNPAIEAIINGVPVFVTSDQSLAWDVANHHFHNIENPSMPDRSVWANDLAYCEWSTEEIYNGTMWNHIKKNL